VKYAPGSTIKDNAQYTAHTNCIVDQNGIIQNSYDRTHVLPGDEKGYTDDDENGPDMRVHASSDCLLVGQKPKIASPAEEKMKDELEPLLGKVTEATVANLRRRSPAAAVEEVNSLARLLARDPSNVDASRRLMLLSRSSLDAAAMVLELTRRQTSSSALYRRDARAPEVPPSALLAALASSRLEAAHMHLVEMVEDHSHDLQGLARAALTFATEPSEAIVNRVANMTAPASANVVVLGSLVSSSHPDDAARTMAPHLKIAVESDDEEVEDERASLRVMLGVGNMGSNALFATDALIRVASDVRRSLRVRLEAIKSLRDVMSIEMVRNEVATLLSHLSPLEVDLKVAIIEVATKAARKTRSLRTEIADSLDMAILNAGSDLAFYSPDVIAAIEEFIAVRTGGAAATASTPSSHLTRRANEAWKLHTDTKWNSTKSSTYDLVQPLGEREKDMTDFPQNGAGLAGVYLGWEKLNLQVAGGAFGGIGKQGCLVPDFKAYTRARASLTAFGRNVELLDARIHVVHRVSPPLASAGVSVVLMNKSILNEDLTFTCKTWVFPVAYMHFTVLDFNYDIPIYIASISVGINVSGDFRAQVDLTVCAEPSARVAFKPTVSATLTGSGGVALVVVRGAINVRGSISYTLGPEIRALVPSDGCKVCLSLNQGWEPARVVVSASVDWRFFFGKWRKIKDWDLWAYSFAGREFSPINGLNVCFNPVELFKPKPKQTLERSGPETKPKSTTSTLATTTSKVSTSTLAPTSTITTTTAIPLTTTASTTTSTTTTTIMSSTTTTTTTTITEKPYTIPPPSTSTTTTTTESVLTTSSSTSTTTTAATSTTVP
ncbi:hypothetical protein HDU67_001415, partial [Dinochytrium kinnereticum]